MAGQNGVGAGAGANMYNGMNGAVLPSAGQYADMQLLMQNMETLSGYMQQNREEWARVQEGLERVERMRVCSDPAQTVKTWVESLCLGAHGGEGTSGRILTV